MMIFRAALLFLLGSMAAAQTANYSDIASGRKKLPYGQAVTLQGKLSELKCGTGSLATVLKNPSLTVSYLGQTTAPVTATISGDDWSAPLGSLPADHAIVLQLKVSGKIADATRAAIVSQLLEDPSFKRALQAFFDMSLNQPASVVQEDATRLVRDITDTQGALTKLLTTELSCVSISDASKAAAGQLLGNVTALANPGSRMVELKALQLEGLSPSATAAEAAQFVAEHFTCDFTNRQFQPKEALRSGGHELPPGDAEGAAHAACLFQQDYQNLLQAFNFDVVAALTLAAEIDTTTATKDLAKYAGFDAGAVYIPRIDELRQFFMIHVYPWGPLDLDTNGVPVVRNNGWKDRLSFAFGVSTGDLSGNSGSRIKDDKTFIYGFGYRVNKYFRFSAGGALFRDTRTFDLHNEAFVGPSVDLTALPGLKQIFASASSKSDTKQ